MKLKLLSIFFLISVVPLFAQENIFTLEKAIIRAMDQNRDIKIARLEKDRAKEKYWEALSTALPQIDGQLSIMNNLLLPFFYLSFPDSSGKSVSQKIDVGYNWQYGALLTLNQPIYTFGRVTAAVKIADYYEEATDFDYITARDQVIETTYLAYTAVHLASIKVRVNSFNYDLAKQNFELVEHRFKAGLANEFELLQSKVNMDNLAPDVILAQGEYERALNNLKMVLVIPVDQKIELSDTLKLLSETVMHVKEDIWKRPDYQAELWRLKMYDKNTSITYSDHLPSIGANMQYQFSGANVEFGRNADIEGQTLYLSVGMNIPLFTGFRTQSIHQQSVIDYNQANYRLAKMKDEMENLYENAQIKLEESKRRLVASQSSRKSALKALQIAQVQKATGGITELDFQASQFAYEKSERNYYLSVYDYNLSYLAILKSVGKLDQLFDLQ